jgi:hypothetical protein
MLLKDVLNSLIYTELNNLSIGKPEWNGDGNFTYVKLIDAISQGYLELHKRFALKKEVVRIVPMLTRTVYPLELQYALSDPTVADKFIYDSVDRPFSGQVAKIDTVLDDKYERISYNTTTYQDDVIISDYTELTINVLAEPPITGLRLICRTLPNPIVLTEELELETYVLNLPVQYREALLCFAAAKIYINRGAENATNNESAIYFARFEQACNVVEHLGLNNKEETSNQKLTNRGFA